MSPSQFESTVGGVTIGEQAHSLSTWFVVALRLMMGYVFLSEGWDKLTTGGAFGAEGFLAAARSTGSPLAGVFEWMSTTPWAIEFVNIAVPWGEVFIGLGLLVGAFTRLAAFWGAFMMFLIYLGNWSIANGTIVSREFEYMLIILSVAAFGAGRMLGLDAYIEQLAIVQRHPWLKYILG